MHPLRSHCLPFFVVLLTACRLMGADPSVSASATPDQTAPAAPVTANPPVPDIENDYFRVLKNASAPPEANANIGARVIVALKNVVIGGSGGERKLERGQITVFNPGEAFTISGEYFEVSFKSNHPPLLEPTEWVEPTKNTVIHDAPDFRIFEERLEENDTREVHSHAQRVVIRLNNVQLTDPRFHDKARDGKGGMQVPDTAKYADPIVHAVKNLGPGPLFNIVIEYKLPPHAPAAS